MLKKITYKQSSVLLLLMLLSMSVLVYQTAHDYVQSNLVVQAKALADSSNSDNNDAPEIAIATQGVFLSVSTIQLDQELHQIKEILFGDDKKEENTPVFTKYVSSFFKTLFEQVISPNAP